MASASAIRLQIEAALARRIPSALTPVPRVIRPIAPTGVTEVDALLEGGLPIGAISELAGPESSGRTSLALSFLAGITRMGSVAAWVDVSDAFDPASAAAAGADLAHVLWVRCGAAAQKSPAQVTNTFTLLEKYKAPAPITKGLHGGGCGGHPRGEVKGMAQAVSGLLHAESPTPQNIAPRCAEPQRRDGTSLSVSSVKRDPSGVKVYGALQVAEKVNEGQEVSGHDFSRANKPSKISGALAPESCFSFSKPLAQHMKAASSFAKPAKPWSRIEQALRVTDLLLQAGGFSAIILDMGSLKPEFASRVPLATWFRYRAAAERTQTSLLLITQHSCAKSSAELLLRFTPAEARRDQPTVFTGMDYRVEVDRRRFTQSASNVIPLRKPPQRETGATWRSQSAWAGVR
jgi:recombination protein RecA